MNKTAIAATAALMAVSGSAFADLAETKGGIKVKTEDGRFEMNIGGRVHFDGFLFSEDTEAEFGSPTSTNRSGTQFRREYLTLTGKFYGWDYKFEHDFAAEGGSATCTSAAVPAGGATAANATSCTIANTGASGNREMWVSTQLGPGKVTIGQFKPYRGMEELTSSNEITLAERPVTSATGIYAGRQFLMGVGYKGIVADQFGYGVDLMQLGGANITTEGRSYGGRGYWFPMAADGQTVHVGLSYHIDSEDIGSNSATPSFAPGGRRGTAVSLGNAGFRGTSSSCATTANKACGSQDTLALEVAASYGAFTGQAEYATATLEDAYLEGANEQDADVDAWYLQASWFITGEKKPYKKDRGAFGSPKPTNAYGAWEAVVRYESIENKDESETNNLCAVSGLATGSAGNAAASQCEIEQLTLGLNWYVNPNVRFLLNYYMPTTDLGGTEGKDEPDAATLRTQFSF